MKELPNDLEPQDVEDFIKYCEGECERLGVSLEYYMEEFHDL